MSRDGDGTVSPTKLPLVLRLTAWTCRDDCAYHCTHRVTNDAFGRVKDIKAEAKSSVWAEVQSAIAAGSRGPSRKEINERIQTRIKAAIDSLTPVQKQMVQYHGKCELPASVTRPGWLRADYMRHPFRLAGVFIRVLGAQEPLSVLFSLMNLAVHVKYIPILSKKLPDVFPLKLVYLAHAFISANAWTWSALFHTRDKSFTEKMDYFSAGAAILSGFFFTVARLFRLAPQDPRFALFLKICGAALTLHILYLSVSSRFNYSYNMTVNVML